MIYYTNIKYHSNCRNGGVDMALNSNEVISILRRNGLKQDIYKLIQYSDEIKEYSLSIGNILNRSTIIQILSNLKEENKIPKRTSNSNFIRYMTDILEMFEEVIIFDEKRGSTLTRYVATYTSVSPYEIALSLLSKSFLSHYSSLYVNDLTLNNPKDIYINKEQSKKPEMKKHNISQNRVDYAFSKKMRATTMIYNFKYHEEFYRVHVLNSKNTNNTGIISKKPINFSEKIRVTNLDRTLIDIVVRPQYSGGVKEILEAYVRAKSNININKIVTYLEKFNYLYPYYKSILFFLDYANYDIAYSQVIEGEFESKMNTEVNFYLDYQITNKILNKKIGVYYPPFLDNFKKSNDD